jgi:glutamyl-tRNA synthetase
MPFTTRIAPSPTGDMHIGTARTAYFNWLLARASGGKFILRIDDTDQQRSNPAYTKTILEIMEWLGLDYDAIHYQSQRLSCYAKAVQEIPHKVIRSDDRAKDGAIVLDLDGIETRLGQAQILPRAWEDQIAGGIDITADDVRHANGSVLIKSDGTPSYNWACVVDDVDMDINYILRGADHITNTSRQILLYTAWKKTPPWQVYAHVGLIAQGGKLLSKRDGAASMLHYKNAGYDRDAMLNFLARLGWGPKVDDKTTKILPRERMLELFIEGGNMRNSTANMDMAKLEALDRKYKAQKGIWRNKDKLMMESPDPSQPPRYNAPPGG